jgi:hypothetical protein
MRIESGLASLYLAGGNAVAMAVERWQEPSRADGVRGRAMASQNRKSTKEEMGHVRRVIQQAYPEYTPVFGGHSSYGGHRAPRVRTISFRLRDRLAKYHSNVVWLMPEWLSSLTPDDIRALVTRANGEVEKRNS